MGGWLLCKLGVRKGPLTDDEYRAQIQQLDEELGDLYSRRREVMEAFAAEHPAVLPAARQQTDVQRRVARCPRCGGNLDTKETEL